MDWDAAARTEEVAGAGERLALRGEEHLDERHKAAIERLRVLYGYPEGIPLSPFFATLAHSPEFFAGYIDLGVATSIGSALSPRHRELTILRTAWLCGAPYIWGEHVRVARESVLSADEIEKLTCGTVQNEHWDEIDGAVMQAVDELHARSMINDATWQVLARHMNQRQLLELPMLAGHYVMTAYVQNSLRCRLTDHNVDGLAAR